MLSNCTCGHNLIDVTGVVTHIETPSAGVFDIGAAGMCPDCPKIYAVIQSGDEEIGFVTFNVSHADQAMYVEMKGELNDREDNEL